MQKNEKVLAVVIGIIVILLFVQPGGITKTDENVNALVDKITSFGGGGGGSGAPAEQGFISVGLYDKDGNKIVPNKGTFSIVGTTPGVSDIDFTITVPNTGSYALSCDLVSLSPTPFDDAFAKTSKAVPVGGKAAWTSSRISVAQFESQTPTEFSVSVRCSYNPGTGPVNLDDKVGTLSLSILPDASGASFEVNLYTGGTPTEFCGDTICQESEDSLSCPGDCAVANNVNFRTTDLSYVSGSSIAYITSASCGSDLTKYSYSTKFSDYVSTDCITIANARITGCGTPSILLSNLKGGWMDGGENPKLIGCSSKPDNLYVCDTTTTKGSIKRYNFDAGASVDNTPTSFDSAKEVAC